MTATAVGRIHPWLPLSLLVPCISYSFPNSRDVSPIDATAEFLDLEPQDRLLPLEVQLSTETKIMYFCTYRAKHFRAYYFEKK